MKIEVTMCPILEHLLSKCTPKQKATFMAMLSKPKPEYREIHSINGQRVYGTYLVTYPNGSTEASHA
jgi:hypothetical protein